MLSIDGVHVVVRWLLGVAQVIPILTLPWPIDLWLVCRVYHLSLLSLLLPGKITTLVQQKSNDQQEHKASNTASNYYSCSSAVLVCLRALFHSLVIIGHVGTGRQNLKPIQGVYTWKLVLDRVGLFLTISWDCGLDDCGSLTYAVDDDSVLIKPSFT